MDSKQTYRIPFVLGLAVALRDLGMVSHKIVVQVLLIVDVGRCLSQAPSLLGPVSILDRADAKTVAQEEFFVEGRCQTKSLSVAATTRRTGVAHAYRTSASAETPLNPSRERDHVSPSLPLALYG